MRPLCDRNSSYDRLGRRFVAIFSHSREDFTQEMDLQRFYAWTMDQLASVVEPAVVSDYDVH